ncbi:MAG: GntP family permease, partial [Acidobacteria bacterium]|nr:GntP family permease [Acidobacteriota bacterium]
VLGSIIAEAMKHTGAIQVITRSMVSLVGESRMPLALTLAGFVLGIAIFSDVAYVILNPLVHSAARVMGVGIAGMATGLVGALQLTHAVVPPTPGPLAAAALVGADIGKCILFGSLACLTGSLAGWAWGRFVVGPRIGTPPADEFAGEAAGKSGNPVRLPGRWSSFAPIAVPLLLISGQSILRLLADKSTLESGGLAIRYAEYLGWPVAALSIGVWLAFRNIRDVKEKKAALTVWVEDGLRISAMIIVVTGLGGSLSEILKGTPAVQYVADVVARSGMPAVVLPFVIGIIGNLITGSTTVGVITAGSLTAPMLGALQLSPEAAMLSGASGSVIIKYVNSSYFWVCTSLTGLKPSDAIYCFGGVTLVGGVASFLTVYAMWATGLI